MFSRRFAATSAAVIIGCSSAHSQTFSHVTTGRADRPDEGTDQIRAEIHSTGSASALGCS